jgi:hypothetical protein
MSFWGSSHLPVQATFRYILQHPRCLQKLEEEITTACLIVEEVNDKNLASLPYLNACINEVLRLAAPFNSGILQHVPREAFVDGICILDGVSIVLSSIISLIVSLTLSPYLNFLIREARFPLALTLMLWLAPNCTGEKQKNLILSDG